jgi:hypothetical protein
MKGSNGGLCLSLLVLLVLLIVPGLVLASSAGSDDVSITQCRVQHAR